VRDIQREGVEENNTLLGEFFSLKGAEGQKYTRWGKDSKSKEAEERKLKRVEEEGRKECRGGIKGGTYDLRKRTQGKKGKKRINLTLRKNVQRNFLEEEEEVSKTGERSENSR